jgi:hypothetical protein
VGRAPENQLAASNPLEILNPTKTIESGGEACLEVFLGGADLLALSPNRLRARLCRLRRLLLLRQLYLGPGRRLGGAVRRCGGASQKVNPTQLFLSQKRDF